MDKNTTPRDLIADYVEDAASLPKPAEHPYASILRAIADGLEVQWNDPYGNWGSQNDGTTLIEIVEALYPPGRYRIKPRTVTVNGIELPAPETVPPANGTICFFPNLATSGALSFVWAGTAIQLEALADGIVHLTKDAAAQWKEALLSITKGATA